MADDLDLDELHQAVNDLMSSPRKAKKSAPARQSVPLQAAPAPVLQTEPAPQTEPTPPNDTAEKIEVKRPLPSLAPRRSRGRTMDIVGPKRAPLPAPSTRPKRQASSLQPTGAPVEPELPQPTVPIKPVEAPTLDEPADDVLAALNLQQENPQQELTAPEQKSDWPDPLDMHGFKDEVETAWADEPKEQIDGPDLPTKPASPIKPDPDDAKPQLASLSEEPNSPFVTTKVEKRPLGAYADAPVAPQIEPTEPIAEPPIKEPELPQTSDETVALEIPKNQDDELNTQDLRQMSIPKQYESSEKSPSKDNRPVFDTNEYHPPIDAHAAHRGSTSWGWVLILVFAIVLVAALGFAYYLMNGSLDLNTILQG